jgi:polysaccharide pyruvyl transferase WcaK-like protein
MSVREPGPAAPEIDVRHYHALLANAADFMVDRLDADIAFVPMERRKMDMQHSHAVIAQMRCAQRATVLKGEYTSRQLLSLFKHFDFAVGMRLHFLIFAALQRVPFVALPYAGKVEGFLQALDAAIPPMRNVTAGRVIDGWNDGFANNNNQERMEAIADRLNTFNGFFSEDLAEGDRVVMDYVPGTGTRHVAPAAWVHDRRRPSRP